MKTIGVDGRLLQGNLTGVGKYVLNLINYITEEDENISFIIYTNREILCRFGSDRVKIVRSRGITAKIKPMIWSKIFLSLIINRDNPDIFLAGDAFIPLLLKVDRIISVVHDLNSIIAPGTMSRLRLITDKLFFKQDIKKAHIIISNSFGTSTKLEQYYQVKTDLVIHPIIDCWFKILDTQAVKEKLHELSITYPYLLSVATQEPRKNLDKTINAFITLKKNGYLVNHKLLLVGSKGWKSGSTEALIKSHSDEVKHLGYTPDEIMPYLYNGADLFVFPSSYEGFGIPVREAMLCGTPVITTNIPELREASYNKAIYINPLLSEDLEKAIIQLSEDTIKFNYAEQTHSTCDDQLHKLLALLNN